MHKIKGDAIVPLSSNVYDCMIIKAMGPKELSILILNLCSRLKPENGGFISSINIYRQSYATPQFAIEIYVAECNKEGDEDKRIELETYVKCLEEIGAGIVNLG